MNCHPKKTKVEHTPLVANDTFHANHGGTDSSSSPAGDASPEDIELDSFRRGSGCAAGHDLVDGHQEDPPRLSPLHRWAYTRILIFQTLVSVAFLAVRENIILYCTNVLFYTDVGVPTLIDVYAAVVPCLPVFGGILADLYAGRFRMIKIGAFVTLTGILFLSLDVIPFENWYARTISIDAKRAIFVLGFTIMFVGFGCYGANVGPFAARQVERAGENAVRTLFHWFYWSTIFGLALALPIADYVERQFNFGVAFSILTVLLIIGIIVLVSLRSDYVDLPPHGDALTRVFKIIYQGLKRRIEARREGGQTAGAGKADKPGESVLDYAKRENGGSYCGLNVDEVKHLLHTLPAFHTVTIYAIVFYFVSISYRKQFNRLNPYIGDVSDEWIHVPNVTFELYVTAVSLISTPFFCYLYPWLELKGFKVTPLRRIGVGIFFSLLSVFSASMVEFGRKDVMRAGGILTNVVGNVTYEASTLSCLVMIPQYTFVGLAESFVRVAGLEYAYLEGPEQLKGLSTGLYILMSGVGSYILAKILVLIVNSLSSGSPWYVFNINNGHMEYFFLVLAGIQLFDLLYIYLVSRKYEYAHWRERAQRESVYPDVIPGNNPFASSGPCGYSRVADTSSASTSDTEGSPRRHSTLSTH